MTKEEILAQIAELQARLEAIDEKPVMIPIPNRNYEVAETHTTVAQYRAFCEATDREMPEQPLPHYEDNPVVNVDWYDAKAYCDWLSQVTGDKYDLLSDDEYEYCCADHREGNPEIAVYNQNHIARVKSKKPNKFGLYDMLGNAWQWLRSPAS